MTTDRATFIQVQLVEGQSVVTGNPRWSQGHRLTTVGGDVDDGIFAGWRYESGTLHAWNDGYGMFPLFYSATADGIILATSLEYLTQQIPRKDWDHAALAVFLRIGFFLGEDTPFQHIKALPPAAKLSWAGGQLHISSQVSTPAVNRVSEHAAIDDYISLFRASVQRRLSQFEGRHVVPLSGGQDSRQIFLELSTQKREPIHCVSLGMPQAYQDDPDVVWARKLVSRVPVQSHTIRPMTAFTVQNQVDCFRATHLCADEHLGFTALKQAIGGEPSIVWDGIAGDVLSAGHRLRKPEIEMYQRADFDGLARSLLRTANETYLSTYLTPRLAAKIPLELAVERIQSELKRHVDAPNPLTSFIFWNRTRREIALCPYALLCPTHTVLAPYLDHAVFRYLISLPAEFMVDQQFHKKAIARAFPQYSEIGYAPKWSYSYPSQSYGTYAAFARDLLSLVLAHRHSGLLNTRRHVAHLAASLVPTWTHRLHWIATPAIYLLELDRLSCGGNRA